MTVGGPAYNCGILDIGDRIIAINGSTVNESNINKMLVESDVPGPFNDTLKAPSIAVILLVAGSFLILTVAKSESKSSSPKSTSNLPSKVSCLSYYFSFGNFPWLTNTRRTQQLLQDAVLVRMPQRVLESRCRMLDVFGSLKVRTAIPRAPSLSFHPST